MKLVSEVEVVLIDLTRLAGREEGLEAQAGTDSRRGHGPAVPGVDTSAAVVAGQADIDDLLSDLGI
jgi:chemotaxis regulatin CheY-phosphate phosphatase CheZ